jgi:hypothetical protein
MHITEAWLQSFVEKQQVGPFKAADLLKKLTHLKLENKQVQRIDGIQACKHLRVLYLFDNLIPAIENLGFARNLTHLYLQNNCIARMQGMESLGVLQKLYLDGNEIRMLEGLEGCPRLEELHMNRQRTPATPAAAGTAVGEAAGGAAAPDAALAERVAAGQEGRYVDAGGLWFDMASIATVAQSLQVLELADNALTSVAHLCYLGGITSLNLKGNALADAADVGMMMSGFQRLRQLELHTNPIESSIGAKGGGGSGRSQGRGRGRAGGGASGGAAVYRDTVFLMSETLVSLDGKEITPQQRAFLQQREMMRRRRRKAAEKSAAAGGAAGDVGGLVGMRV